MALLAGPGRVAMATKEEEGKSASCCGITGEWKNEGEVGLTDEFGQKKMFISCYSSDLNPVVRLGMVKILSVAVK